ncbi:E3 ubiquitin-protein ligase TRIM71-like [Ruditapes philippinarum]|uniref:E3 ubiquitin-protein ligase TRIM71-like n=1 Tax=Ruditapes philippinarum TaxID=129788 RepID=UPI00295A8138|nr:E3 ubiquitin-protein ligase TRIM71-like [Ruditapes philippinarum]
MAEGAGTQLLKDGSDADFELTCTPCGEDNIREEAIKYCPECQEYLCITCNQHHGRLKATKRHVVVDKDAAKQCLVVAKAKCYYHPDRDIEMYCKTHDMVYCVMCIATEHRLCEGVNKIEAVSKSCVNQTEIQQLLDETKKTKDVLSTTVIKHNDNLTSIDQQRKVIQEKLDSTEMKLIEQICQIKIKTEDSLNEKHASLKEKLNLSIGQSSCKIKELKESEEQLQTITKLDKEQQFVHIKLMKKAATDAFNLEASIGSDGTMSISFTGDEQLKSLVMAANSLGQVISNNGAKKVSEPKHYKIKSKREVYVRMDNDASQCKIADICQLTDGQILVADYQNKKVKQLGVNYKISNTCDLDASPTGICCISKNEIAVKMANNKIQFISIGSSNMARTRVISIEGGIYCGILYFDKEIWISRASGIDIYNISGTLTKKIGDNESPKKKFKSTSVQHMAVSGDTVIVTDYSDGAVCLNKDGTVLRELRDQKLIKTRGVCVADDGTVFLCGYTSNNIVIV